MDDLVNEDFEEVLSCMEGFQAAFVGMTRPIWRSDLPFTGDTLYNFSRQWEYPYAWANIGAGRGRILDAGSGITFFPFLLASAGYDVACCDTNSSLANAFAQAQRLSGTSVHFSAQSITAMAYGDNTFDVVVCISVIEHVGAGRAAAIKELARVLKPGGRLVLTCDLSLSRDCDTSLEDLAVVLLELQERFKLVFPLDLHRPPGLLTSDQFRQREVWRLPWRPFPRTVRNLVLARVGKRHFHSIAVLGLTADKLA
jgi:SAM-dependent methyltransferase